MQTVSVPVPTAIGGFSPVVSAQPIDPLSSACKLGVGLTPFDTFQLYVMFSPSLSLATDPNVIPYGIVRGNTGDFNFRNVTLGGFPFFAVQRLTGGGPGTFFATGTTPPNGPTFGSSSTCPVGIGSFSLSPMSIQNMRERVLLGLSSIMTEDDTFNVFGTDDPTATGASGSTFLGQVSGGGGLTGTFLIVEDYDFLLLQRTGGATNGFLANAVAFGRLDAGRVGTLAPVFDQPAGGLITPGTGTPQQLVDQNFIIVVEQTTPGQTLTLADPTDLLSVTQREVTNVGTASFQFYGMTVQPFGTSPQHSTAKAAFLPTIPSVGNGWTLVGNS